jgi:hypothetical protein
MLKTNSHILLITMTLSAGCSSIVGGGDDDDVVDPPADEPTMFTVRITNQSGGAFPTPLSPVAWAVHNDADPLFDLGDFDRGAGLEALAEDGNPGALADTLAETAQVIASAVFNLPSGALIPGPIFPGGEYAFTISALPEDGNLTLATMLVQSNDVFLAPDGAGIPLFDADGLPIAGERDVTEHLVMWDSGTEANQSPGFGPDQAPRQSTAGAGAQEGLVRSFSDATRALPLAAGVADLTITEDRGEFTVTVKNVSADSGAAVTPIAPVFYSVHNSQFSLFAAGLPDRNQGLETLAEDGSPAALVGSHTGAPGTLIVGAQVMTLERPTEAGAAMPGETFQFTVRPDAAHPYLTVAAMVVQSNDAFLAFSEGGLRLLDDDGTPRAPSEIDRDVASLLAIWDAGTEANEIPGAGIHQPLRQTAANEGPADADPTVRLYRDATNDLAGAMAGNAVSVSITQSTVDPMTFDVVVENRSTDIGNALVLTPVVYAVHDDEASLFVSGTRASAGLEVLAESGSPVMLRDEIAVTTGVRTAGVQAVADGAAGPGPITPGGSYSFSVTMDSSHRFLSVASMVVPSNDTFIAFPSSGIELIGENGQPRSAQEIAADLSGLIAWDAGTEANQAGAVGRDQPPRQSDADAGALEGNGRVRSLADPIWSYPAVDDVIRVTITPVLP